MLNTGMDASWLRTQSGRVSRRVWENKVTPTNVRISNLNDDSIPRDRILAMGTKKY